jgi:IS30 family transposase
MKTKHDDGLEWLREIRRNMAAKFDYDPRKAAAYYQNMQRRHTGRFYRRDNEVAAK